MTERRSNREGFKATAAHRMETLIALSLPFSGPNDAVEWIKKTHRGRIQLATEIIFAPRHELAEAQELLEHRIFTTNSPFSSLALRISVMNVFAEAAVEILEKKDKVEAARAKLQEKS